MQVKEHHLEPYMKQQTWSNSGMEYIKTVYCLPAYYWLKKDAQLESCELNFIWGKMRVAAQEATSQIAWDTAPKQQWGKVNI